MSDLAVAYSALQGMVIGPDGSITYDFQGTVKATAMQMNAGPKLGNRLGSIGREALRWVDATAATMGYIYGWKSAGADEGLNIEARPPAGVNTTQRTGLTLKRDSTNATPDQVIAFAHPAGIGGINDTAFPVSRKVIDGAGASDFVQALNVRAYRAGGPYDGTADRWVPSVPAGTYLALFQATFWGPVVGSAAAAVYIDGVAPASFLSWQYINVANNHQTGCLTATLINHAGGDLLVQPRNGGNCLSDSQDNATLLLIPATQAVTN